MKDILITRTISRILHLLPNGFHIKSIVLILGIFANSIFEIVGLAAVLPLLASVLKKGFIHETHFTEYIYSLLNFQNDDTFIVFLCSLIFTFILLKNFFGIWLQRSQANFSWDLHESLSNDIFEKAYERGFLYFTQNNSNVILNRISSVPMQFAQMMMANVFQFINEIIVLLLIVISLLAYDHNIILLLIIIILPVFLVFYQTNKRKISSFGVQLNELNTEIVKPIFEVVFGYLDVVINGVFNSFKAKHQQKIKESKSIRIGLLIIQSIPSRLMEICVIMAVMIMLMYGLFVLKDTNAILTLLSIFGLAAYRIIPSVNRLILSFVNIKNFQFTLEFIEEFNDQNLYKISNEQIDFEKKIQIKSLAFEYPDAEKEILSNFSLEIEKGESIGIIGKSGSGKTTLMNILLGFLNPTAGEILVDDTKLTPSNITSWQKKCGYVRQDVFLVDGNLLDNVAFGIETSDIDYVRFHEAIGKAKLSELLKELPHAERTNIGERGAKLSGGQRQRVGIARALYHGAEILFFDEATSALDSETENEITEAIRSLHESQLTMVIIAHRESTLKYCNRIVRI